ncbi:secretion protein HlyD family protein [Sulfuricella denitrificans skB26]|uniref:Secretion protein HlyD family protein n=1 Tax=Sulfuricella denitrificans (strain DSM 22764 / NBRC 105220 / skB26) TaxID=1163617 RepID=S6ABG0_SULDS|nr:efflux RND transporter periplasmic adaptor subunit [Sulfuricella denitrificans]BAN34673.1 secretion protein HlyD family protein [Sulfuricella denitrificans skB26]
MTKWIVAGMLLAVASAAGAESFPATLQWSQRVELSPRVSGIVREVGVNAGDRVQKGRSLLSLDAAPYLARVAESRATVTSFKEETAEAQRDLVRTQELYDRTVISTTELDQARLRQARAKAQLDGAQARLARERQDLTDSALRAPFDAVVVARLVEPGQNVAVGLQPQPLLVLAKAGEMVARFKVSADRIGSLKTGQAVTVAVGRQDYPATLKNLGLEPVKDKDGAVYEVDAVFAVKELLRAGVAAVVKLPE